MKKFWTVFDFMGDHLSGAEFSSYQAAEDFAIEVYDGVDLVVFEAISVISASDPTAKKLKK